MLYQHLDSHPNVTGSNFSMLDSKQTIMTNCLKQYNNYKWHKAGITHQEKKYKSTVNYHVKLPNVPVQIYNEKCDYNRTLVFKKENHHFTQIFQLEITAIVNDRPTRQHKGDVHYLILIRAEPCYLLRLQCNMHGLHHKKLLIANAANFCGAIRRCSKLKRNFGSS